MKVQKPKEQFLQSPDLPKFHQAVAHPLIARGLDVALMEYVESLGDTNDPVALSNYYRIQGAKAFRRLFLTLGDVPEKIESKQRDNLSVAAETYIAPKRSS